MPHVADRHDLRRLADVGARLCQPSPLTTLSGGERQRLKLATRRAEKGGIYALDRRIVFEGTPADLVAGRSTLTGEHLAV